MRAAGIYVAFDEFKGHTAAVRGSQRFRFAEADFDNPGIQAYLETRTGGSRGPGTLLNINLAFVADRALTTALAYDGSGRFPRLTEDLQCSTFLQSRSYHGKPDAHRFVQAAREPRQRSD